MQLELIRKEAKLSIYELSKRSGISQPYIKDLESGKKSPTLRTLEKLAAALGISVGQLINEQESHSQAL